MYLTVSRQLARYTVTRCTVSTSALSHDLTDTHDVAGIHAMPDYYLVTVQISDLQMVMYTLATSRQP